MVDQGEVEVLNGDHGFRPVDFEACMAAPGRAGHARLLLNEPVSR